MNYKILTLIKLFNNKEVKSLIIESKRTIIIDKLGVYVGFMPVAMTSSLEKSKKNKIIVNL